MRLMSTCGWRGAHTRRLHSAADHTSQAPLFRVEQNAFGAFEGRMRVPSIRHRESFRKGFRRWIRKTINRILYGTKYNPERFWFLWGLTYKRVFYKRYLLKGNVKRDNLSSL